MELSMLIKRCLTYGVQVYPHEQEAVLRKYEQYKIPDDKLAELNKDGLKKYVRGLYLLGQEMSNDWTRGHRYLKELGFIEKTRKDGHSYSVRLEFSFA